MEILVKDVDSSVARCLRREIERKAVMDLLTEHYGADVHLEHRADGAPYLPDYPTTYIGISHTVGSVAVALDTTPIGIDIEQWSERLRRVAPRILDERLVAALQDAPNLYLLICHIAWTSAEALFKLLPESTLITDFTYSPKSLVLGASGHSFCLEAFHKQAPERLLHIEGWRSGGYVLSIAKAL